MTTSDTVLEVKHVSVDYGYEQEAVHAVSDVSLVLRRGEILGLAGESGCGKSTLANTISHLLRDPAHVTQGEVVYYSREGAPTNVLNMTKSQLQGFRWSELAVVFQSAMNALNPVTTLGAQIDDVIRAHRPGMKANDRKARALELLKLVGISSERIKSYPHELSGGMRQRAGIAIALALTPEIIIMDEPTTALDVVVQREILTEILRLRDEFHFAVIFITHDLSLLLELADRVAIMYAGRIVEQGTQRDLYRHPRHPYSHGLIHSFPSLHGPRLKVYGIPGSPPDLRILPASCAFNERCPMAMEICQQQRPSLQQAASDSTTQQVACHLYQANVRPTPPTPDEIERAYVVLGEERKARV
jgi:peptide/nickel transport system ATP-binding protein